MIDIVNLEVNIVNQSTRILAATDLSAPARHAVERAAQVSKELMGTLDLLHVANLAPLERLRQLMGVTPADMEQRLLDAASQKLHHLAAALAQRFGVTAGTHVAVGSLLTELSKTTDSLATDLLVCGAKGESIVRHYTLGTTASRMLSKAKCPILVVKQPPHESYRRLLVPVDFSPSSLPAIHLARRIAPHADIVLLHVFDVPFEGYMRYASVEEDIINHYRIAARQEAIEKLNELCHEAELDSCCARQVVLHGDPPLHIIEQEQEWDCDLIVMGKHGESLLEEFLLGSVTKHVLSESQGDVLVSV